MQKRPRSNNREFNALGGVLLGMAALRAGAGPRTASNDLYYRIMLILIGASPLILLSARSVFEF